MRGWTWGPGARHVDEPLRGAVKRQNIDARRWVARETVRFHGHRVSGSIADLPLGVLEVAVSCGGRQIQETAHLSEAATMHLPMLMRACCTEGVKRAADSRMSHGKLTGGEGEGKAADVRRCTGEMFGVRGGEETSSSTPDARADTASGL
jgi:hypothetical protein